MAPLRALALLGLLLAACAPAQPPGPALSEPQLKYRVFAEIGRPWYCDPDFYPIARADGEKESAAQRFPEIQRDAAAYQAILQHLGLVGATTDDQKLAVYREWKQLNALRLQPMDQSVFGFTIRVERAPKGSPQPGEVVDARIDVHGRITVIGRTPSGPPNCPICLAADAQIATPRGAVAIIGLRVGDLVWTLDEHGARVAAPIVAIGSTQAPAGHEVVALALADGRAVRASPGHPLVDGRTVGALRGGDALDGSVVLSVARVSYVGETHDLLPTSASGAYWANGVLLSSSLR